MKKYDKLDLGCFFLFGFAASQFLVILPALIEQLIKDFGP